MSGDEGKELRRAKDLLYRRLAARQRSRAELAAYLSEKEIAEDVSAAAIEDLARFGFIDDAKFARQYARYLLTRKSLSRYALRMELRRKGISEPEIEAALDDVFEEEGISEESVALLAAERKFKDMKGLKKEVARRRLADYLRRRGHSFETIARVQRSLGISGRCGS